MDIEERAKEPLLQQPYVEEESIIIDELLFKGENYVRERERESQETVMENVE